MIWLQTPSVFWLSGRTISLSYSMYMGLVMLGRQIYIYIYIQQKQIMPEISAFHFEMAMEKLK